jgi:phage shock protein C
VTSARLERSNTNRVIAGVCGGIAEYLALDPTLVRVFVVLGTILTGGLLAIAYLVMLILMPLPGRSAPFSSEPAPAAAEVATTGDPAATAKELPPPTDPVQRAAEEERRRMAFGYVLIAVGIAFLLGNAGLFRLVQWQMVWPLVLIGIGVLFLVQRARS